MYIFKTVWLSAQPHYIYVPIYVPTYMNKLMGICIKTEYDICCAKLLYYVLYVQI